MDEFIERSKYIKAFQKQLNEDLAAAQAYGLPRGARIDDTAFSQKIAFQRRHNLDDGTVVVMRPIRLADVPLIQDMHQRLSPTSIYYRYLHAYRPTYEDISHLCHLDDGEGAAFVAIIEAPRETVIGLAYYLVDKAQPNTAEPAILIEDRFQGQGLGTMLMQHLSQYALNQGIHVFNALIHADNRRMMRLIHGSGLPFEKKFVYGAREVRVLLA